MHICSVQLTLIILCGVLSSVENFHLPNLDLNRDIDIDSSKSNTGLIHSYLQNNWSQSLNIGSVSIAATIIILFVASVMHLQTQERITQLAKNDQCCQRDIQRIVGNKPRRQPHLKPNPTLHAEEEV